MGFVCGFQENKGNRAEHVVTLMKVKAEKPQKSLDDNAFCHCANSDIPRAFPHMYLIAS